MPAGKRPGAAPAVMLPLWEPVPAPTVTPAVSEPAEPHSGPRPWEPIDEQDRQLGWQYTYVTPRRAYEIRREIEHG